MHGPKNLNFREAYPKCNFSTFPYDFMTFKREKGMHVRVKTIIKSMYTGK